LRAPGAANKPLCERGKPAPEKPFHARPMWEIKHI
jgi:hypothetical protein